VISKRFSGNDIHTALATTSALAAGFTPEEASVIAEHSHDPDYQDLLFDRGFQHVQTVTGFGGAASMTSKRFMTSVNNQDVAELGRASHYLADVASVFHTTLHGQSYHKFYEEFLDIVQSQVVPISVSGAEIPVDIMQMVTDFSNRVYEHYPAIYGAIRIWDEAVLISESKAILEEAARLTTGLFLRYKEDVANGVQYVVPLEPGLNTSMILAVTPFVLLWPFGV
jgi:hypothetical protein